MDYFAPRFPLDLPASNNPHILDITLAKIDPRDLTPVMKHWENIQDKLEGMKTAADEKVIKRYFRDSVGTVCQHPVEKNSFGKYLIRPHITVHSGARAGNQYSEKVARAIAHETGVLARRHGFSFWYGGGAQGLMGETGSGFAEDRQPRFSHQYSLQVSPAQFVAGVKTVGAMKAVNEGLAENTDAAIVTPNFIMRRHILDTTLTKSDAAMTVIGAEGSLDEWADIATHIKTGLMKDRNLIGLNPVLPVVLSFNTPWGAMTVKLPVLKTHFWNGLDKQRKNFVTYGYGTKQAYAAFPFFEKPEQGFSYLMRNLDAAGLNPHQVYERNLEAYQERQKERSAARPAAAAAPGSNVVRFAKQVAT